MRFLCFAGALAQHNRICKQGRSEPKDSGNCCFSPEKKFAASVLKIKGCCNRPENKTGQLKKGCPVCCFHIINLNETNRKRVRKAGCPSRTVCRTQKSRFLHESASLEPENADVRHPRIALLKKEKCCCKYELILQQHLLGFYSACFVNVSTVPSKRGRYL